MILIAHMSLTRLDPRWAITEAEAKKLALAWGNWRQHYNASPLDPKTVSLLMLGGVVWEIEGTRFMAMAQARAAARAERRAAQAMGGNPAQPVGEYGMPVSNVVPMYVPPGG